MTRAIVRPVESPRRTIRVPAADEVAIRAYVDRTPGATFTDTLLRGARELINRELAPQAFVLDRLNGYVSLDLRVHPTANGDTVDVEGAEARREVLGRRLPKPQPIEQLVNVEARRERAALTVVELVGLPGDEFAGVRVYVATVPSGADVRLNVQLQDLYPTERPEESA